MTQLLLLLLQILYTSSREQGWHDINQLEVRGRARREAARRRKSEWKVNLDNRKFQGHE